MTFYRCSDRIPLEDRNRLGVPNSEDDGTRSMLHNHSRDGLHIMAVRTDDFRPPSKGEWYLSGARPTAWRAPSDYLPTMAYRIMRLVVVRRSTTSKLEVVTP